MSAIRFGTEVRIQPDEVPFYRKGGASTEGSLVGLSRQGTVARVRLDNLEDTFVRTSDLELVVAHPGPRATSGRPRPISRAPLGPGVRSRGLRERRSRTS